MSTQRPVKVEKNSVLVGNRNRLNLIEGANVTLTVVDDPTDNEIEVTIAASAGTALIDPESYIMWRDGATYYCRNGATSAVTSNANFVTLINATIAGANAGDSIHIKPGTYIVATSIVGASGVSIIGEDYPLFDARTMAASDTIIEYIGSLSAAYNLNANAAAQDATITMANTGAIAGGDWVYLQSAAIWKGNDKNMLQGEIFRAGVVVANTSITLPTDSGIIDAYTTANTAHVHRISPMIDVTISGIKFLGETGDNLLGVLFELCVNCHIYNCRFDTVQWEAVDFYNSVGGSAHDNTMYRCNRAGFGYGVVLNNCCQGIRVYSNFMDECRHGVAIGGFTAPGIPRSIDITDNHITNGYDDSAIDCHSVGENIVIKGNVINHANYGIATRFHSGVIANNVIIGCFVDGIQHVGSDETLGSGVVISGNKVDHCDKGIQVDDAPYVSITGNVVSYCRFQGIDINNSPNGSLTGNVIHNNSQHTNNTYDGIDLDTDSNGWVISGNRVYSNAANRQRYGLNNAGDNNLIIGNHLTDGGATGALNDTGAGTTNAHNVV